MNLRALSIIIVCSVKFSEVAGKCYLAYSENLSESVEEWFMGGPNRFYFTEAYNVKEKTFDEPPYNIINIGKPGKGKGKGKSKAKKVGETENKPVIDKPVHHPVMTRKLRTLDLFAGCGGKYILLNRIYTFSLEALYIYIYI